MFDQEIYEVPTWCIAFTFQPTPVRTPSRFAANKCAAYFCLLLAATKFIFFVSNK